MIGYQIDLVPEKLPRTMTRKEWTRTYRWLRETRGIVKAKMQENEAQIRRFIEDVMVYGSATTRIDYVDKIANPPVVVYSPPKDIYGRA